MRTLLISLCAAAVPVVIGAGNETAASSMIFALTPHDHRSNATAAGVWSLAATTEEDASRPLDEVNVLLLLPLALATVAMMVLTCLAALRPPRVQLMEAQRLVGSWALVTLRCPSKSNGGVVVPGNVVHVLREGSGPCNAPVAVLPMTVCNVTHDHILAVVPVTDDDGEDSSGWPLPSGTTPLFRLVNTGGSLQIPVALAAEAPRALLIASGIDGLASVLFIHQALVTQITSAQTTPRPFVVDLLWQAADPAMAAAGLSILEQHFGALPMSEGIELNMTIFVRQPTDATTTLDADCCDCEVRTGEIPVATEVASFAKHTHHNGVVYVRMSAKAERDAVVATASAHLLACDVM